MCSEHVRCRPYRASNSPSLSSNRQTYMLRLFFLVENNGQRTFLHVLDVRFGPLTHIQP